MALESIHNQTNLTSRTTKVHNKQRVISETTGLVKFNLSTREHPQNVKDKVKEYSRLNQEFRNLEKQMVLVDLSTPNKAKTLRSTKSGLNLGSSMYSPQRSPPQNSPRRQHFSKPESPRKETFSTIVEKGELPEDLFTKLASKQRQVLDYKTQMEHLKQKSKESERELRELEKQCNNLYVNRPFATSLSSKYRQSQDPLDNPFESPVGRSAGSNTLRNKASISKLKLQIESSTAVHQENFNKLKKKISMVNIPTSTESYQTLQRSKTKSAMNLNKFQNDTKVLFNRSINYVNTLSRGIQEKMNSEVPKYDEFNGDTSDEEFEEYGKTTRSILTAEEQPEAIKGGEVFSHDRKDDLESEISFDEYDSDDWGYGEADQSDYMVAVK